MLNNPTGIFAKCHGHIPTDHYHTVTFTVHRTRSWISSWRFQQLMDISMRTAVNIKLFISRLASKEHVTVAAVCSGACVLLWAAMPKPAPAWVLQLVIGGKLPIVVSLDWIKYTPFRSASSHCIAHSPQKRANRVMFKWSSIRSILRLALCEIVFFFSLLCTKCL